MKAPSLLRKHIRGILSELFSEREEAKFFIKFNGKKNEFELYKKYKGEDADFNIIDKIDLVKKLGSDPEIAQQIAKEIAGQDLIAKLPSEIKKSDRGSAVLQVDTFKGEKLEDIPIPALVNYILITKWMRETRKWYSQMTIYEYLTQDRLQETKNYLAQWVKAMRTKKLVERYNEYWKSEKPQGEETIVFEKIVIPIMKAELDKRNIQFENGVAIPPNL